MRLSKSRRKKLITAVLVLVLFTIGAVSEHLGIDAAWLDNQGSVNQTTVAGVYKVTNIEDGDTITVDMNGNKERVRFIGVDTPEIRDPRKPVQCFGRAASAFTKDLIADNDVRLEADPENTNRDRYDRLLRYIYLPDNTLVNAEIIKQGYGFAYTSFPFTKKDDFKQLEIQAKQQNKGLWGSCTTGVDEKGYNTINPDPNP